MENIQKDAEINRLNELLKRQSEEIQFIAQTRVEYEKLIDKLKTCEKEYESYIKSALEIKKRYENLCKKIKTKKK